MVTLDRRKRAGPILTPSSLPCLATIPAINITEGCAHNCLYCYSQGYSRYPGKNHVVLFDNLPELVQAELCRKRRQPRRVYFSPSCDAFQPLSEVQDVTYDIMKTLLRANVEIAFLTKGAIDDRFISLFSQFPGKVFAQVGITTTDESISRALEPGAALPKRRLQTIKDLWLIGALVNARLDPLVPGLTDAEASLAPLLSEIANRGIRTIAASYLFLRPSFARGISRQLRQLQCTSDFDKWPWQNFAEGIGGGRTVPPEERKKRFERLRLLAAEHGIGMHICACKNPDVATSGACQIAGFLPSGLPEEKLPLFHRAEPPEER